MLNKKSKKRALNFDESAIQKFESLKKHKKLSESDKFLINNMQKLNKYLAFTESAVDVEALRGILNQIGMEPTGKYVQNVSSFIRRVDVYMERFPEIEYLIDMIASSIIYTSSSNTRKIEVILNGEYEVDSDETTIQEQNEINVNDVVINQNTVLIDSFQKNVSIKINELFKDNNIKLSLYDVIFSILKYGLGIFYIDDDRLYEEVSFYGLDKVKIEYNKNNNEFDHNFSLKNSDVDDSFRKVKEKEVKITVKEDGKVLKNKNIYFITDRDILGKSLVSKIINYLKIIELLELSMLIERLSKTKNLFVQKLDMEKIEEEDIYSTLLLYKNLIKSKTSFEYDEENDQVYLDIVRTLVDNNVIVPTENDNLKIEQLKSEFKPLLEDINYYQDKIYHTLGIPLHYRKGTDSKAYLNNNMLTMHDNVYAMKIRRYQAVINQILTFWIEHWLEANYNNIKLNYVYVNIPEFVPVSERKETDLDKGTKYVSMFSQLQQLLGIDVKKEFIISKLFPNDLITDIIDIQLEEPEVAENQPTETEQTGENSEEEILSLFESGLISSLKNKDRDSVFNKIKIEDNNIIIDNSFSRQININW